MSITREDAEQTITRFMYVVEIYSTINPYTNILAMECTIATVPIIDKDSVLVISQKICLGRFLMVFHPTSFVTALRIIFKTYMTYCHQTQPQFSFSNDRYIKLD